MVKGPSVYGFLAILTVYLAEEGNSRLNRLTGQSAARIDGCSTSNLLPDMSEIGVAALSSEDRSILKGEKNNGRRGTKREEKRREEGGEGRIKREWRKEWYERRPCWTDGN